MKANLGSILGFPYSSQALLGVVFECKARNKPWVTSGVTCSSHKVYLQSSFVQLKLQNPFFNDAGHPVKGENNATLKIFFPLYKGLPCSSSVQSLMVIYSPKSNSASMGQKTSWVLSWLLPGGLTGPHSQWTSSLRTVLLKEYRVLNCTPGCSIWSFKPGLCQLLPEWSLLLFSLWQGTHWQGSSWTHISEGWVLAAGHKSQKGESQKTKVDKGW